MSGRPGVIRRAVTVRGQVQGVFFRDSLREEAQRRGVAGWVSNAPDGSVEAELEGMPEDVEALVRWCRAGTPQARVDDVEVEELEPRDDEGFDVR